MYSSEYRELIICPELGEENITVEDIELSDINITLIAVSQTVEILGATIFENPIIDIGEVQYIDNLYYIQLQPQATGITTLMINSGEMNISLRIVPKK